MERKLWPVRPGDVMVDLGITFVDAPVPFLVIGAGDFEWDDDCFVQTIVYVSARNLREWIVCDIHEDVLWRVVKRAEVPNLPR